MVNTQARWTPPDPRPSDEEYPFRSDQWMEPELLVGTRPLGHHRREHPEAGSGSTGTHLVTGTTEATTAPHLGWIAPLADLLMGRAFSLDLGERWSCVTLSLRIDALAPMRSGVAFTGWGVADDPARARGCFSAGVAQGDVPVAKAIGRFAPLPRPGYRAPTALDSLQSRGLSLADGLGLEADGGAPDAELSFSTGAIVANPSGVMHGGLQASVAAEAALRSEAGAGPATHEIAELSVTFLAPVVAGGDDTSTLRLRRVHTGRSSFRSRVEILGAEGGVASVVDVSVVRRRAE